MDGFGTDAAAVTIDGFCPAPAPHGLLGLIDSMDPAAVAIDGFCPAPAPHDRLGLSDDMGAATVAIDGFRTASNDQPGLSDNMGEAAVTMDGFYPAPHDRPGLSDRMDANPVTVVLLLLLFLLSYKYIRIKIKLKKVVRSLVKLGDTTRSAATSRFDELRLASILERNDVEMLQVLVEARLVDLMRDRCSEGKTLLFYAHSREMVEFLCKAGGSDLVNAKASNGQTALHEFATGQAEGSLSFVKCLIETFGADVLETDESGWTPLHTAASFCEIPTAAYLVKKGGSELLEAFDDEGFTAFHVAVCRVDESMDDKEEAGLYMIKCLLESCKANILATDAAGRTALHLAVDNELDSVCFYLVEHGGAALVSAVDTRGMTVLHYAASKSGDEYVEELARAFVDVAGAELVVVQDNDGRTALHCAAADTYYVAFVYFLIDIGGAELINAADSDGKTSFHLYAKASNHDMLRFIIDVGGTNFHAVDADGCTALHYASSSGNVESAKCLVQDCGVLVDATDNNGSTPLHRASASVSGTVAMVQFLESHGANINAIDANGLTVLQHACSSGSSAVVEYWIATHDHNVNVVDRRGWSALHHACGLTSGDSLTKARLLLAAGATPHAATETGITALHLASTNRKLPVILLLFPVD